MASHVVSVTEFKAKCLSLIEAVSTKGDTITVTKRGKPLVTVSPAKKKTFKSTEGIWKGKVVITDEDIQAVRDAMWNPDRLKEKFGL